MFYEIRDGKREPSDKMWERLQRAEKSDIFERAKSDTFEPGKRYETKNSVGALAEARRILYAAGNQFEVIDRIRTEVRESIREGRPPSQEVLDLINEIEQVLLQMSVNRESTNG